MMKYIGAIFVIILTVAMLCLVGFTVFVWVKYGGKPITEIPFWALWFMWGGIKE